MIKEIYSAQPISPSTLKVLILGLRCAYISRTFRKVLNHGQFCKAKTLTKGHQYENLWNGWIQKWMSLL